MILNLDRYDVSLKELNRMAKSRDSRRDVKKKPQKTAKEKRQARREKKNR